MIVQDIIKKLDQLAPLVYAEEFDNVGLIIGDKKAKVDGILITLDTTLEVIDEAIEKKCTLIISFHPIIFNGLKKVTGKTYVEKVLTKAIKYDISVFAIHTRTQAMEIFHRMNYYLGIGWFLAILAIACFLQKC